MSELTNTSEVISEILTEENSDKVRFSDLGLTPKVMRAIEEMGFETATSIQAQAIPLIRTGADVIGRSQTGTGKTVAFGIPAIEVIDTHEEKSSLQVLILCPTRELAQQACEEIKKLAKHKLGIRPVEVYGGVPMDRQVIRLKKANIVIGTPGRVMDHMRRRTMRIDKLKMIVLDEADEMLSMGFKEDIETILLDTPETRQTVLFSATMPPSILSLTKQFQTNPQIIEIDKKQVTLANIEQLYIDAPMGRKMDALNLLLRYYTPKLTMIFCNTKRMVDEITEYLTKNEFDVEGLHGDMKQSQRTKVMDSFKFGKTSILVATDVAARGIDVNNIDYVINFDIPQNTEYYVHRIGRTGRAGKSGKAVTICSGRRQVFTVRDIARAVKSDITMLNIPTLKDIKQKSTQSNLEAMEAIIAGEISPLYVTMLEELVAKGHEASTIAAAALQLSFSKSDLESIEEIKTSPRPSPTSNMGGGFQKISINIGRDCRVAPNHIVAAITERAGISGGDIGKIEIFDEKTIVSVPADKAMDIMEAMIGCKVCGKPTMTTLIEGSSRGSFDRPNGGRRDNRDNRNKSRRGAPNSSKPRYPKF